MTVKNALRIPLQKKFTSNALSVLESEPVPVDKIYCIQQVAWEIDTATSGGNTRVRLFIDGHGYNHYIQEQDGPSTNTLYTYSIPLWLVPGEMLAIEIDYAGTNTVAKMWLTGYWNKFSEGIIT